MEKFDAARGCAKCGSLTPAKYEYHSSGIMDELLVGTKCGTDGEHMHRTCPDCGTEWEEVAADAS
jgi:hypothetical protein